MVEQGLAELIWYSPVSIFGLSKRLCGLLSHARITSRGEILKNTVTRRCCKYSIEQLANRRTVDVRPQIIEYEHRNRWLVPAPACLYAGPMIFIMLMCILFIIPDHCMLSGCNVSINQFNPIEVPFDSLFLKQSDCCATAFAISYPTLHS